jgi:predicted dehydrogenase
MKDPILLLSLIGVLSVLTDPSAGGPSSDATSGSPTAQVRLMTLDPGHFHAALVQKTRYEQVSPLVSVYAPEGPELQDYLDRVQGFNSRTADPTAWVEQVYKGPDFLEKMVQDRPGNVVVISGNNARKTEYILRSVQAGIHVLADKPMVITPARFPLLVEAFRTAQAKGLLLYDIMTERYEITTILQKELARIPEVFGELEKGTPEDPAVTQESVHTFIKSVAGSPLIRPAWFFDVQQQGEGLVDVATHLVDLVQWECFPGQIIDYKTDIRLINARHWPTEMSKASFLEVTGLKDFPEFLKGAAADDTLKVSCNGQMTYAIKGVHARVSVTWSVRAPEGGGDSHASMLRGTRSALVIRQGKEERYEPCLYVEARKGNDVEPGLNKAVNVTLQALLPGIGLEPVSSGKWRVTIPQRYRVGHEAHFAQVTEGFLRYLAQGRLPAWEPPNMMAKYYTTTSALDLATQP